MIEVRAGEQEDHEAVVVLSGLIGRELGTITGFVNTVIAVEPPNVLVATAKSPQGQLVPIAEVQKGLDLLRRDGQVSVDVATLGHRSSFVGAVLASREDVTVAGSPPVVSLLDADGSPATGNAQDHFGWHLTPGEQIKRTALHERYGGSGQGGISPSSQSPNILIFTDPKTGEQHGYFDGWQADGLFHYTGEGQRGDQ